MVEVLGRALSFILIIVLGYTLKKRGLFSANDYKLVGKIVLNVTLPAAVVNSFAHFQMDFSLLAAVGLGLISNIIMIILALLLTRRQTAVAKMFYVFSLAGFNIGCFTMPFVQAFMTPFAVVGMCMFDVGNSIMCTGLTYALTASIVGYADGRKDKFNIKSMGDKLFHSMPFITYLSMLALAMMDVHFPSGIYRFTTILGTANPFLSMLMIGMMFELTFDKESLKNVGELFIVRYLLSALAAFVLFYFKPFSQEINSVLTLGFLAPATILGPIFIGNLGGNVSLASFFNSLSIVTSVSLFTAFFVLSNL